MIPDSFKQDLLNRVDIVDVITRYVQLKKAGANYSGLCPFHNEKSPSFSVSPSKQFYHCFGCGVHGNAIGFLMAYSSLGYVDAVKELAAGAGLQMPEFRPRSPAEIQREERATDLTSVMERAMVFYRGELKKSPRAIDYLKGRGLSGEIAARYGIGYAPDDWQGLKAAFPEYADAALVECGLVIEGEGKRYDRFRDRVMFPIFNARGATIGFGGRVIGEGEPKYLNSPETPLFEKGRELYGLVQARQAISEAGRAMVVEGYMDVVALAQFGVANAVATLGTATTPVHVSKLLRLADELVFAFDGDAAGRKAAWRALEVALPLVPDRKPVRFLFLPEGEDPDTYVRKHGKEKLDSELRGAPTLSAFLISQLRAEADLASPEGRARFLALAKPHLQQITAPGLRIQIANEIAELGRVSDAEMDRLMEVPQASRQRRSAPAKSGGSVSQSLEWNLLACVLTKLRLAEHIESELLTPDLSESKALIAIRDLYNKTEDEPTLGVLVDGLQGDPSLEVVLRAHTYAEQVGFDESEAQADGQAALTKLEVLRRKRELDAMIRTGLVSREARVAYAEKLGTYNRLRGAVGGTS